MAEEPRNYDPVDDSAWKPGRRGWVDKRNRTIVSRMPSLLNDMRPCDPHHYPVSRGRGATDGLLEMVPVTREQHNALHDGSDPWMSALIESLAPAYFERIYETYANTGHYLGPPERVREVREAVHKKVAERRRLLGVES